MKTLSLPTILCLAVLCFSGYKAQAQMFGNDHTIGGTTYNYVSSSDDGTYITNFYSDGDGGTLSLRGRIGASVTLAEVYGAFEGYYNGDFHPMSVVTSSIYSINFTSPNGRQYTQQFDRTDATLNLESDSLDVSDRTIYVGSGGEFSVPQNGADGDVRGAESGWVYQGQFYLSSSSTTTYQPGAGPSLSWFGSTYHVVTATSGTSYDAMGNQYSSSNTTYHSSNGGSFTFEYWEDASGGGSRLQGSDPYVGIWAAGGSLSAPEFQPLQSTPFLAETLWVNGIVVSWNETVISNTAGVITSSFYADGISVTAAANARSHAVENTPVEITVTMGGQTYSGTQTSTGAITGFDPAVCDLQLSDPNRTTPLFSDGTLYVDGAPHEFTEGYEDSTGVRKDHYEHNGALLTLSGDVSDPTTATVKLGSQTGTFSTGVFAMQGVEIITQAVLSGSPPAFWVHGVLYIKGSGDMKPEKSRVPASSPG